EEAVRLQPLLRPGTVERALLEPGAMEIDVHALHQFYVHGLRGRGGQIVANSKVHTAESRGAAWRVQTSAGGWEAPVVANAAGAWADVVAAIFGARPDGVPALRRTAFMIDAPPEAAPPMIDEIDEAFYVKPEGGQLLCSPSDETPQEPGDARADEIEIARAIDAISEMTTLDVRHVRARWAGLRTFAPDRTPVVGFE